MNNKCCDFLELFFQQLDITNTALADQENKNSDWSSDTCRQTVWSKDTTIYHIHEYSSCHWL